MCQKSEDLKRNNWWNSTLCWMKVRWTNMNECFWDVSIFPNWSCTMWFWWAYHLCSCLPLITLPKISSQTYCWQKVSETSASIHSQFSMLVLFWLYSLHQSWWKSLVRDSVCSWVHFAIGINHKQQKTKKNVLLRNSRFLNSISNFSFVTVCTWVHSYMSSHM